MDIEVKNIFDAIEKLIHSSCNLAMKVKELELKIEKIEYDNVMKKFDMHEAEEEELLN